jgi:hypothetical protein
LPQFRQAPPVPNKLYTITERIVGMDKNNDNKGLPPAEREKLRQAVIKWFAVIAVTALSLWLAGVIISRSVAYIEAHSGVFLGLLGIIGVIVYVVYQYKTRQTPAAPPILDGELERGQAERTYVHIGSPIIFDLFKTLSKVYPFVEPAGIDKIYSPLRARKLNDIWYYEYVSLKLGEINISDVQRFLSEELKRTLLDDAPHGLARNKVFIGGVEYPALFIDRVKDAGEYVQVSVVVSSEKYYRHSANIVRNHFEAKKGTDNSDDEFI